MESEWKMEAVSKANVHGGPNTLDALKGSADGRPESEVGGKRVCKDRAPQPGGRFVPSVRAARSVIHVESGIKCVFSLLPFSLLAVGQFPFSLQDFSVGTCLGKSEQI